MMQQLQCAYCLSTNVKIVASEANRDVTVVECLACGKTSQTDVENPSVDLNEQKDSGWKQVKQEPPTKQEP